MIETFQPADHYYNPLVRQPPNSVDPTNILVAKSLFLTFKYFLFCSPVKVSAGLFNRWSFDRNDSVEKEESRCLE